MEVTPLIPQGAQLIDAYGNGGFKIAGQRYAHSVIVVPNATMPWEHDAQDPLLSEDFSGIFAMTPPPEVVLLGLGGEYRPLPHAIRTAFRSRGIAVDAMDTGAACRTFNILLAEGRRVVALLVAV